VRLRSLIVRSLVATLAGALATHPAFGSPCERRGGEPTRIVLPGGPVAPGESVQLGLSPPPGDDGVSAPQLSALAWELVSGPGCVSPDGLYAAPYVVSAEAVQVRIQLVFKIEKGHLDTLAAATLRLRSGAVEGADACLGPGQEWGACRFPYVYVDELPVAIHTVEAVYPTSARARGIQGALIVNMLVCRTGRVLDAWAQWGEGMIPEPTLEAAALEAARQWIFRPASRAGTPVATAVAAPFRFKL